MHSSINNEFLFQHFPALDFVITYVSRDNLVGCTIDPPVTRYLFQYDFHITGMGVGIASQLGALRM